MNTWLVPEIICSIVFASYSVSVNYKLLWVFLTRMQVEDEKCHWVLQVIFTQKNLCALESPSCYFSYFWIFGMCIFLCARAHFAKFLTWPHKLRLIRLPCALFQLHVHIKKNWAQKSIWYYLPLFCVRHFCNILASVRTLQSLSHGVTLTRYVARVVGYVWRSKKRRHA